VLGTWLGVLDLACDRWRFWCASKPSCAIWKVVAFLRACFGILSWCRGSVFIPLWFFDGSPSTSAVDGPWFPRIPRGRGAQPPLPSFCICRRWASTEIDSLADDVLLAHWRPSAVPLSLNRSSATKLEAALVCTVAMKSGASAMRSPLGVKGGTALRFGPFPRDRAA